MPGRRHRRSRGAASPSGSGSNGTTMSRESAGSNSMNNTALKASGASCSTLNSVFDMVLAGNYAGAKSGAGSHADMARSSGRSEDASRAGLVWQVANAFESAKASILEEDFNAAKNHASTAANQARALGGTGCVAEGDLKMAIDNAGQLWTEANKAAEAKSKTDNGLEAPIIDQNQFDHGRGWAFCGLATTIMMLRANGIEQGQSHSDLNRLADRMYYRGQGTSGADMAQYLREKGIKDSTYTLQGSTNKVVQTLDKGQVVPLGVLSVEGVITELEGGSSRRYAGARVGQRHSKSFGGHWVLVTGYEGKAEAPSHFLVNDPDLGGELKVTPKQLQRMAGGNGNFWMVHQ